MLPIPRVPPRLRRQRGWRQRVPLAPVARRTCRSPSRRPVPKRRGRCLPIVAHLTRPENSRASCNRLSASSRVREEQERPRKRTATRPAFAGTAAKTLREIADCPFPGRPEQIVKRIGIVPPGTRLSLVRRTPVCRGVHQVSPPEHVNGRWQSRPERHFHSRPRFAPFTDAVHVGPAVAFSGVEIQRPAGSSHHEASA